MAQGRLIWLCHQPIQNYLLPAITVMISQRPSLFYARELIIQWWKPWDQAPFPFLKERTDTTHLAEKRYLPDRSTKVECDTRFFFYMWGTYTYRYEYKAMRHCGIMHEDQGQSLASPQNLSQSGIYTANTTFLSVKKKVLPQGWHLLPYRIKREQLLTLWSQPNDQETLVCKLWKW